MFVHLNTHSIYSAMKGLLSLSDLMNLSKISSMDKLALTDVNGMWGFIKFIQNCRGSDIQPIAGANLITDRDEVVVLVENKYGYENLCRSVSAVHEDPRQSVVKILKKHFSGLFILSLIHI